jgi:hypothetical protein
MVPATDSGHLPRSYRFGVLLGQHGYDFMNFMIVMDWYSTILFFATVQCRITGKGTSRREAVPR